MKFNLILLLLVLLQHMNLSCHQASACHAGALTNGLNSAATNIADLAEKEEWQFLLRRLDSVEDIDVAQADGMTALHWACYHQNRKAVDALLAAGADQARLTLYGISPLSIAVQKSEGEIVKSLLDSGGKPNQQLPGKTTLLMLAAKAGFADNCEYLLDAGAEIEATERKGQTALMWAAAAGNAEVVDLLIQRGADLEKHVKSGLNALFFAAREGHIEVVARLLDAGVDVNSVLASSIGGNRAPRKGTSALILAVESGHFELALFLVQQGADPNDQRCGYAPLHVLSWVRKPKRGEDPDGDPPPRGSGRVSSLKFARALIERGADVNLRLTRGKSGKAVLSHKGATPLLLAGKTADLPYLKLLVELGGDPNIPNAEGATALMAAAGIGVKAVGEEPGSIQEVKETIDFLLEHGLDVNTVDENGETAMHGAAYRNYPEIVDHLVLRGADASKWNHKNKHGWTPVMIAQGNRPGSFKPSPVTVAALERAMK